MSSTANTKYIPKDAQVITAILKEFGINEFDPRVIHQLLEFVYWHTSLILDDARVFANHAKKKNIDVDDVKLAIQMQAEQLTSAGPPRDILLELARGKNSTPLSPVKPQSGIRLPPDRYCLTQPNYKLKSNLPNAQKRPHPSSTSAIINVTGLSQSSNSVSANKQMRTTPPQSTVKSRNPLPETSAMSMMTTVLLNENNLPREEVKTENDIDLMEIDPLSGQL